MDVILTAEDFDEFRRLLEQPPRDLPRLRSPLSEPSPFEDES